jgi:hypothetical protein
MVTGLRTAVAGFTVVVADRDPGADLHFDDVVEIEWTLARKPAPTSTSTHPIDEYLLRIWPTTPSAPATLEITSTQARYWLSDKRQRVVSLGP